MLGKHEMLLLQAISLDREARRSSAASDVVLSSLTFVSPCRRLLPWLLSGSHLRSSSASGGVYRTAKGYVTLDAGDALRTHVTEMKRSLTRRRKPAPEDTPHPKA